MISGGNLKPANAKRWIAGIGRERRGLILATSARTATSRQCNSASGQPSQTATREGHGSVPRVPRGVRAHDHYVMPNEVLAL